MEKKRLTALKTRIKRITAGKFVARGDLNPNYVLSVDGLRISRARILGTVVDKFVAETGKFASVTLDDGTDTIRAKVFTAVSMFGTVEVGDVIDVIGRIREYQNEIYIIPEAIKKPDDVNWELLRELELREGQREWDAKRKTVFEYQKQSTDLEELKRIMMERFGIVPHDTEAIVQSQQLIQEEIEEQPERDKDIILKFIAGLDKGNGCDYSELIEKSGLSESLIDAAVEELLGEGSCFEPRPGKIKKL